MKKHQLRISHAYAKFHVLIRRMGIKFSHEKMFKLHICLDGDSKCQIKSRNQQQVNDKIAESSSELLPEMLECLALRCCVSFSHSVHVGELVTEFHVNATTHSD